MNTSKLLAIVTLLTACGTTQPATSVPIFTSATTPTLIATTVPTLIGTPALVSTPDFCNSVQWQGEIQVLTNNLFDALEPGNPVEFNRILIEQNPAWVDFQQDAHGEMRSAGVIFHETAFGPELGTGVNPAVLLVTYGVEHDWVLPANGNLISEVDNIRAELYQHHLEWALGEVDENQYPPMNAATYTLYRYFDGDLSKLEIWCHTYVQVYGQSSVR